MSQAAVKKRTGSMGFQDHLNRLHDIPTLPAVAVRVNQLINDPTSSSSDIAEVLKKDQVLTAKILRLANSPYYSIPGGVNDVKRALAFLGFNTLAQLVLGISVFSLFTNLGDEQFSMMDFWKHALGTAVCSEILAKKLQCAKPEEAFTCGLLHDIGKLVLFQIDPECLRAIVAEAGKRGCGFIDVEREWDLTSHAFLGEVIATKWGLPQTIRLAIRYHHFDVSAMDSVLASAKPTIQIVRLANMITVKNKLGKSGDCSDGTITSDMLQPLGLSEADIPAIEAQLLTGFEKAGAFLSAYR